MSDEANRVLKNNGPAFTNATGFCTSYTDQRVLRGICGLCGGYVTEPAVQTWPMREEDEASCGSCGATVAKPELPILNMVPKES